MAKDSRIEWTHHTFNPWWGCTKVSPACDHCYAEAWAKRVGQRVWGKSASRRHFGERHFRQPLGWNDEAKAARQRRRVFCASMADVFEQREDLATERARLWELIAATPWLDWLLLTKRPGPAVRMVPWRGDWPQNVWLGATVENEYWAKKRLPYLLRARARVRFVSCEPLLGPIQLEDSLGTGKNKVNWVIAGGESGGHARPMDPAWLRSLREQCRAKNVPFHFKQWGNWRPAAGPSRRRLPVSAGYVERVSKRLAGRRLDGRVWDQFPGVGVG